MFGTEEKAVEWFEGLHWPDGQICCLKCGSTEGAYRVDGGKPMPCRCRDCKKYFSLKTGTAMEDSKLPLRLWAWAIYLELTVWKTDLPFCRQVLQRFSTCVAMRDGNSRTEFFVNPPTPSRLSSRLNLGHSRGSKSSDSSI